VFVTATVATAKYGALSEALRRSIAEARLCSMFCGGKNCKYEGSTNWSEDQQAICGLYSHWYEKWSVICAFIIVVMQSESGQICVCVLIMQLHMEQGKQIFITHKCSCGSALGCICLCVCVCVCLSVCLSCSWSNFWKPWPRNLLFFVCRYIFRISRPTLYARIIRLRSRSMPREQK